MAYSVWHEDGTAHYEGMFEGTGHDFVDWVGEAHSHMERHSQQITNVPAAIDAAQSVRTRRGARTTELSDHGDEYVAYVLPL